MSSIDNKTEESNNLNEFKRNYHSGFDYAAQVLGYENLFDLAKQHRHDSPEAFVKSKGFETIPEFFNADDAYFRIQALKKKAS